MPNDEDEGDLLRLASAVLSVKPLMRVLNKPVCITSTPDSAKRSGPGNAVLLNRIATLLGAGSFRTISPFESSLSSFELAIGSRIAYDSYRDLSTYAATHASYLAAVVQQASDSSLHSSACRSQVCARNGVIIPVYSMGDRNKPAVVIASACGMSATLCERWLRTLSLHYFVITVETRYMFGADSGFDSHATGVSAQVEDLFTAMDHLGVLRAHFMGICGGAVIALMASQLQPSRVVSISLWHGDYTLSDRYPKSEHQQNLQELMAIVNGSRVMANRIHQLFAKPLILERLRLDLAHILLYPYGDPELLFRYGALNGHIMSTNVLAILPYVKQPTLVVTSKNDLTANPVGSYGVASILASAELHVEECGDHLSFFDASPTLISLAQRFISANGVLQ